MASKRLKNDSDILIAPSILSADFASLKDEIREVEKGGADWIHVDVMDGHFVPNLTIGPVVVHWIRKVTNLFLDAHLMIEKPQDYIPQFARAGADSITFHHEATERPEEVIRLIRGLGKKAGVSIRPKTPVAAILPYIEKVDLVLVMTVEPGFGGQKFMPEMMLKVRLLKERIRRGGTRCRIEVDGGIDQETAPVTVKEGATVLVAGNSIFGEKNRALAIKKLRASVDKITSN